MNKTQIGGVILMLIGISIYFFVENEPYTTIAGFIGGIGFGFLLKGFGFGAKRKQ